MVDPTTHTISSEGRANAFAKEKNANKNATHNDIAQTNGKKTEKTQNYLDKEKLFPYFD